jgi:hypothetical protein
VAEKRLKKPKTMGRGGCVFGSSPKQLEQPHPKLVHWWLLVHSSLHHEGWMVSGQETVFY